MNIFVQRASDLLTDHESHGEGLICYSLLAGLARRGHTIFAATGTLAVNAELSPNFHVRAIPERVPAHSLRPWERSWRADRWLGELLRAGQQIDLVWRMNPNGPACPYPPRAYGRPLVLGPLYYSWPQGTQATAPRYKIGIQHIVGPWAERGWRRAIRRASLVICSTAGQTAAIAREFPSLATATIPLIVDTPCDLAERPRRPPQPGRVQLVFAANLVRNKRADIFLAAIADLRTKGMAATGTIIGDGPERPTLEQWCVDHNLGSSVRFAGRLPNADVLRCMADADLLVSTSFGEPYGRNIAEAMSVGTPAVCHRSGGPKDIITNDIDGLLVDELSANAYATRIKTATDELNKIETLSKEARIKSSEWTPDRVLPRLEAELLSALSDAPGRAQ